ncbi:MAG: hypothetical protein IJ479_05855, partial [Alphaproteobacteria bacterium]|nr:hypothetical protein [Alphaproteobacteria bacterium]
RCDYDSSYGTCCTPSGCPSNTSLSSSSYGTNGTDGCEYACYYTCNMDCPSGTSTSNPGGCGGSTRNGCNTKTCYYPYQSCCTPSCSSDSGCSCGTYTVSDGCGGTCTKCSSCCSPSSYNWCSVHSTCHGDCCSDGTLESCDPQCGGSGCSSSGGSSGGGCSKHYTWQRGYVSNGGADYVYSVQCVCSDGSSRDLGTETIWDSCWRCDAAHLTCKANCGKSCYHSDPYYASSNNIIDYGSRDVCTTFVSGSC